MKEAFNLGQALKRGLKVLRDGVEPVLGHRISLDFLFVLIILERDIELEAEGFAEACLHNCVAGHLEDVHLVELGLFTHLFFILVDFGEVPVYVVRVSLKQGLACTLLHFIHCKPDLILALLDRRNEHLTHRILKLDLNKALEAPHGIYKVFGYLDINILI